MVPGHIKNANSQAQPQDLRNQKSCGGVRNYSTILPGDSDSQASSRTTLGIAKRGSLNSISPYSFI